MGKVRYAFFVAAIFAIAGVLYVHDRLAGIKMRRRLVMYREGDFDEQSEGSE